LALDGGRRIVPVRTHVDLSRGNYRVVHADVAGRSFGFSLLGFIPLWSPSYTAAMTSLYGEATLAGGKPRALVNVVQERSLRWARRG